MNQSEIVRAVARATGESCRLIRRIGFSLVADEGEPDNNPALAIDCPGCGAVIHPPSTLHLATGLECRRCDAVYPVSVDELYVVDEPRRPLSACA